MKIVDTLSLPAARFGAEPSREVRIPVSPFTTGDPLVITHVIVPPGGLAEGHIHTDCDEYICFDIGGETIIDGKTHPVPPHGIVCAYRGENHACRNTSPDRPLTLYCVFAGDWRPYGGFIGLIDETNGKREEKK